MIVWFKKWNYWRKYIGRSHSKFYKFLVLVRLASPPPSFILLTWHIGIEDRIRDIDKEVNKCIKNNDK